MSTILTCVFSYNRPRSLANAVRSIDRFFPWGDRLIVDDNSTDQRVREYLELLSEGSDWKYVIRNEKVPGYFLGGLDVNTRFALKHALAQGYRYCQFIQDDCQFVWKRDGYLEHLDDFFAKAPDAIQLQPWFCRRVIPYVGQIEYVAHANAYRTARGFSGVTIWNLDQVRKFPDYEIICHQGAEAENSGYWLSKGFRLYQEFAPTLATIPWGTSHATESAVEHIGQTDPNAEEFLLRPLRAEEIEFLVGRPPRILPYQEYFNLSPENSRRPIWHRRGHMMGRYYHLCAKVFRTERQLNLSHQTEPAPSHLNAFRLALQPPIEPVQSSQGALRAFVRRLVPQPIRRFISEYSVSDYMGYLRLKRRLRKERQSLPFFSITG